MYDPQINDYVKWNDIEGWVYFKSDDYITIEVAVKPKPNCDVAHHHLHRNFHCCVVCFPYNFSELTYVKSRQSVHDS